MSTNPKKAPAQESLEMSETEESKKSIAPAVAVTNRDKRTHNVFGFEFVNQIELEAAYQSNWIARRIVDKPNEDALREWRTFNGKQAKEIANEERRLTPPHSRMSRSAMCAALSATVTTSS